jgi:hypothetical protein
MYTVNTDTLKIRDDAAMMDLFMGVEFDPTPNMPNSGDETAVFTFEDIDVMGGAVIETKGVRPLALLSREVDDGMGGKKGGKATINGKIIANGGNGEINKEGEGGSGGGKGGVGVGSGDGSNGVGTGGTGGGGGGGFGGQGGRGGDGGGTGATSMGGKGGEAAGHQAKRPVWELLQGGSGGGNGGGTNDIRFSGAGGGGSGVEIGADRDITIGGMILANGGRGADGTSAGAFGMFGNPQATGGGGGGSGGGILIHGYKVTLSGMLEAKGGDGGNGEKKEVKDMNRNDVSAFGGGGGGGGGGQVVILPGLGEFMGDLSLINASGGMGGAVRMDGMDLNLGRGSKGADGLAFVAPEPDRLTLMGVSILILLGCAYVRRRQQTASS